MHCWKDITLVLTLYQNRRPQFQGCTLFRQIMKLNSSKKLLFDGKEILFSILMLRRIPGKRFLKLDLG